MFPDKIAPILAGPDGPVVPALCRLSRDRGRVAFWVADSDARGIYVGESDSVAAAQRIWTPADGHISELSWSGDASHLAFAISSGPPPGEVKIGVLDVASRRLTELPGLAFAWAGSAATLVIADSLSRRLYLKDFELGVEHRIAGLNDDGDPHFAPVISLSPDQRRFAVVTRRVEESLTRVHIAHHDGGAWVAEELTAVPGTSLRILPFWSADSAACALYVIDLEQHHTAMIGIPPNEGAAGEILYTSDSIDDAVTPAVHPDGRLIAFVRAHPRDGWPGQVENRLVLLDPVEHAVAPITADAAVAGNLRWLDDRTLLVEGGPAVWTVRLRAIEETAPAEPAVEASGPQADVIRTVVQDVRPELSFACDVPAGWQRVALPSPEADFTDPTVMRPLAVFAPTYATIVFTVATRPLIPGTRPAAALAMLARAQGFEIGPVHEVEMPFGPAAEAEASARVGGDVMKLRLLMIEDGGQLFSITAMAPTPLWEAMRPTLDRIVASFALIDPRGSTVAAFE
jgi:hypothetical protein